MSLDGDWIRDQTNVMSADSLPEQWSDGESESCEAVTVRSERAWGLERKRRPGLIPTHDMPTSSADNTTGL